MLEVTNGVRRNVTMTVKEAQKAKRDELMRPDHPELGYKPRVLTPTAFDALMGQGPSNLIKNPLKRR